MHSSRPTHKLQPATATSTTGTAAGTTIFALDVRLPRRPQRHGNSWPPMVQQRSTELGLRQLLYEDGGLNNLRLCLDDGGNSCGSTPTFVCAPPPPPPSPSPPPPSYPYHLAPMGDTTCDYGENPSFADCEAAGAFMANLAGQTQGRTIQSCAGNACGSPGELPRMGPGATGMQRADGRQFL